MRNYGELSPRRSGWIACCITTLLLSFFSHSVLCITGTFIWLNMSWYPYTDWFYFTFNFDLATIVFFCLFSNAACSFRYRQLFFLTGPKMRGKGKLKKVYISSTSQCRVFGARNACQSRVNKLFCLTGLYVCNRTLKCTFTDNYRDIRLCCVAARPVYTGMIRDHYCTTWLTLVVFQCFLVRHASVFRALDVNEISGMVTRQACLGNKFLGEAAEERKGLLCHLIYAVLLEKQCIPQLL